MSGARGSLRLLVCSVLLVAHANCDVLEEATTFTVDTDWQVFTVNVDSIGLAALGSTLPAVPCSSTPLDTCSNLGPVGNGPPLACSLRCGDQGSCELVVSFEASTVIDVAAKLRSEVPDALLGKISCQQLRYQTRSNSLNFAVPALQVLVGTEEAATPTAPTVVPFASLPTIPAAQLVNGQSGVSAAGMATLSRLVQEEGRPSRWWLTTTLRFVNGQAVPHGTLTLGLQAVLVIELLS